MSLAQAVGKPKRDGLRKLLGNLRETGVADFTQVAEAITAFGRDGAAVSST